jgi:hypothetical protein
MTNHTPPPPTLRPTLLFNAGFSVLSGLLFLIAPGTVGGWLGIESSGWIRLAGLVLVGHAALIAALLPRMQIERVALLNLAAIAPYPLLMVSLVVTGLVDLDLGQVLALADGAIIAAVAVVLALGLRSTGLQKQPVARQPQHA